MSSRPVPFHTRMSAHLPHLTHLTYLAHVITEFAEMEGHCYRPKMRLASAIARSDSLAWI